MEEEGDLSISRSEPFPAERRLTARCQQSAQRGGPNCRLCRHHAAERAPTMPGMPVASFELAILSRNS